MHLSRASTYALYGLAHLAGESRDRYVPLSELGPRIGVSEKHLAKIFRMLARAGILEAVRGVNGGFKLNGSPEKTTMLDVIQIIDGPVQTEGCMLYRRLCDNVGTCPVNAVWRDAQERMLAVLREKTLLEVSTCGIPGPE